MIERDKDVGQQFMRILDEVHKRVVGMEEAIETILIAIFAGGHILLESVPGMGKTMMSRTIADALDCTFKRVQCTADLAPKDLIGDSVYDDKEGKYILRKGPIFTNILLVDEINRAPPLTQSGLLEVMEEKQATVRGTTYELPKPFTVLATQNPVEQAGTYPLPEAQKDRFLFKVNISYPTKEDEISIVKSRFDDEKVEKIFNPAEIVILQREIQSNVHMSDTLIEYAVKIVEATRTFRGVATGGSIRPSLSFRYTAQTRAFLHGRDHVTLDDIQYLSFPLLRHRLILDPNVKEFGTTPDDIIGKILARIEPP
jgi:MoxR-like ATPase